MMFQAEMMRLARGAYGAMALVTLLGLAVAATSVARCLLSATVIAGVFSGANLSVILPKLGPILGLVVLGALFQWLRRGASMLVAARLKLALRPRLFRQICAMGPGQVARHGEGKVNAAIVDGVEALEGYFGAYVPQLLVVVLVPSALLVVLFALDAWVGLAVLLAVLVAALGPRLWERVLGSQGQAHWDAYTALHGRFLDNMQGMTTLVAFAAAERQGQRLQAEARHLYRATMKQLALSLVSTGVAGLGMNGGAALALGVATVRMAQGALGLDELLVVMFVASECLRPLAELDQAWHTGYLGLSAARGINEILDTRPQVEDPPGLMPMTLAAPPGVVFSELNFAYDAKRGPVLAGLELALSPGQTTALVGASGAGKSTLTALLLRFHEADGKLLINGRDLRQIPLADLRAAIGLVAQDTFLFHGTVAENLRLAKFDASLAELRAAAEVASADAFIMALPQGYDTVIGDRGLKLSGGERQRLAIARAVLKNAPILILDEALASVDSAAAASIQAALARLARARTTLVIAHRRDALSAAQRVCVLEGGRIVAEGTPAELIGRGRPYAALIDAEEVRPCDPAKQI